MILKTIVNKVFTNKYLTRVLAVGVAIVITSTPFLFNKTTGIFSAGALANNGGELVSDSETETEPRVCPFMEQDGRFIMEFNSALRADRGIMEARPDRFAFEGGSGLYKISLATYGDHSGGIGLGRRHESWILKFENSTGEILIRTDKIRDLPDDQNIISEVVEGSIFIGSEIVSLTPLHWAYPSDRSEEIVALCAAFDLLQDAGGELDDEESNNEGQADEDSGDGSASGSENSQQEGDETACDACGGEGGGGESVVTNNTIESANRGGGGITSTNLDIKNEQAIWAGTTIIVTWETTIPATSRVYFGTSSPKVLTLDPHTIGYASSTAFVASTTAQHTVVIYGADKSATHYLRPSSQQSVSYDVRTLGRELKLEPPNSSGTLPNSTETEGGGTSLDPYVPIEIIPQCSAYLSSYIKYGDANDTAQVLRLQRFLRDVEGFVHTPQTGSYDLITRELVNVFQQRYRGDVLDPWGIELPTGYVYITTQKKINERYCEYVSQQADFELTDAQKQEIERYRSNLEKQRAQQSLPVVPEYSPTVGLKTEELNSQPLIDSETLLSLDLEDEGGTDFKPQGTDLIKDIDIKDIIPTTTLLSTGAGVIDRFAGVLRGGLSAPIFLGVLSLLLLVVGAVILSRSLRASDDYSEGVRGVAYGDYKPEKSIFDDEHINNTNDDDIGLSLEESDAPSLPFNLPIERHSGSNSSMAQKDSDKNKIESESGRPAEVGQNRNGQSGGKSQHGRRDRNRGSRRQNRFQGNSNRS